MLSFVATGTEKGRSASSCAGPTAGLTRLKILLILLPEYSVLCELVKCTRQLKGTPDAGSYHPFSTANSTIPREHMKPSSLSASSASMVEALHVAEIWPSGTRFATQ